MLYTTNIKSDGNLSRVSQSAIQWLSLAYSVHLFAYSPDRAQFCNTTGIAIDTYAPEKLHGQWICADGIQLIESESQIYVYIYIHIFTHIREGYFTGTITWLSHCQWSNPQENGK